MNYIKFDTIHSTNDFLKSYSNEQYLPDFFYVLADRQSKGRGQREHTWQSDCCKNLLVSFLVRPDFTLEKQILLNKIVSISLIELLKKHQICQAKVKLPNDIMAGGKKIAGILIENAIRNNKMQHSIIGIGLNVNQTDFVNLPEAVSMKNILAKDISVSDLAVELQQILQKNFSFDEKTIEKTYASLSFFKPKE